jgi:hypothetical protein
MMHMAAVTRTPKDKVVVRSMEIRVPMAVLQYTMEEKLQVVLTHLVILKVLGVLMIVSKTRI